MVEKIEWEKFVWSETWRQLRPMLSIDISTLDPLLTCASVLRGRPHPDLGRQEVRRGRRAVAGQGPRACTVGHVTRVTHDTCDT